MAKKDMKLVGNAYVPKSFYEVDCPYANECADKNSLKCCSCRHNKRKKSYYEPRNIYPYSEPIRPWRMPYHWCFYD